MELVIVALNIERFLIEGNNYELDYLNELFKDNRLKYR